MAKSLIRGITLSVSIAVGSLPTWADGVDYVAEADVLVYGGSYFWARTQNPSDVHTLYAQRIGGREVLFQTDGVLSDIKAAPRGNLVGARVGFRRENVSPQEATYVDRRVDEQGRIVEVFHFEESRLVVLNVDGTVVDTIVGVRRFDWDPSGNRIVYLTGTYYEGGFGFSPTGTWTYDLSSKQVERVHSGGVDVQWAEWDGSIYIYDLNDGVRHVLRFDPRTRELAPTSRKGIHFSPDGSYYYARGYEGSGLQLFRTTDDSQIDLPTTGPRERAWAYARGWLDGKTLIVPDSQGQAGDYLYSIEARTIQQTPGSVVPLKSRNSRLFVLEGSTVTQRTRNEFQVLE